MEWFESHIHTGEQKSQKHLPSRGQTHLITHCLSFHRYPRYRFYPQRGEAVAGRVPAT